MPFEGILAVLICGKCVFFLYGAFIMFFILSSKIKALVLVSILSDIDVYIYIFLVLLPHFRLWGLPTSDWVCLLQL